MIAWPCNHTSLFLSRPTSAEALALLCRNVRTANNLGATRIRSALGQCRPGRRHLRLEAPALLFHFLAHVLSPALYLALHLRAGVAHLPHGTPERSSDARDPFASEKDEHHDQDDQQFSAADVEDEEVAHGGAKVSARKADKYGRLC